jgi:peptidoglycan hydrolase CwlO-like protein
MKTYKELFETYEQNKNVELEDLKAEVQNMSGMLLQIAQAMETGDDIKEVSGPVDELVQRVKKLQSDLKRVDNEIL